MCWFYVSVKKKVKYWLLELLQLSVYQQTTKWLCISEVKLSVVCCRKAADQGHAHASYNVALGHIKGIRTDLLKTGYINSVDLW